MKEWGGDDDGKLILYRCFGFDLKCQRPGMRVLFVVYRMVEMVFQINRFLFAVVSYSIQTYWHWFCNCFRIELTFCYCSRSIVLIHIDGFSPFNLSFFTLLAHNLLHVPLVHWLFVKWRAKYCVGLNPPSSIMMVEKLVQQIKKELSQWNKS